MTDRVVCLAGALLVLAGWSAGADNLAPSADFEAGFAADGVPAGWASYRDEQGDYSLARDVVEGHGGTLRVTGRGQYAGAYAARTLIKADRTYLAGGLVKVDGEGQATIKLDYAKGETYLGSRAIGFVKPGEGWRAVRVKDRRADYPEATHVVLAVAIEGNGRAWFDDVYLDEVPRFAHDVDNLAAEGAIEDGVGTEALGWLLFHPEGGAPERALATPEAAHTGRAGLRLTTHAAYAVFGHEPQPLDRTKQNTLRGWVRCRAGAAFVKMDFIGPDGWLGQQQTAAVPADGQWHEVSLTVDFQQYPTAVHLAPAAAIEGDGADADFDDLVWLAD